ncbi:hypothetical protein NC653_001284 [Populus alba x Populus x berolinensis]|uniref:Uncharacterized protein n=1 Tax=Populus alba x Populus x berolinensis TaxID=444605 RepID=A0AAD6RKT2_9ROSI|nr:hypothetical protein NC653_001284 [Populus alba x Populus x berolinensis]
MLLLFLGITLITIISFHFLFKFKNKINILPSSASPPSPPAALVIPRKHLPLRSLQGKVLSGFPRCIYVVHVFIY